jgi:lipoyl-dependent peroxiredoxin subunit D
MEALKTLAQAFPESAKDIRLNLQAVLSESSLSERQRHGVAYAAALASRSAPLREAIAQDAGEQLDDAVLDDAQAAAALMAMNNVLYRFRHIVGKPSYSTMPARLRMNRISQPKTSRADFELMCLVVSVINHCELCVQAHERATLENGLTESNVFDAVRIAATIHAAAVTLEAVAADAAGF